MVVRELVPDAERACRFVGAAHDFEVVGIDLVGKAAAESRCKVYSGTVRVRLESLEEARSEIEEAARSGIGEVDRSGTAVEGRSGIEEADHPGIEGDHSGIEAES